MKKNSGRQVLKSTSSVESSEYKKLVILIIIIATVFLIFYLLTILFTKDNNDDIFKNDLNVSEIQYNEIIVGNMFDKNGEYYVLLLEENDLYKNIFDSYISTIRNDNKKIYTVDLSSAFNKKYISYDYSYDKNDFKVKGTVLIKIDDNEIKEHYESKDDILNKLKELSKK